MDENGCEYESDDERYENNVIETVNNILLADSNRKHGVFRNVSPKSTSNSATNVHPGMFKISVQGDGILDVDGFAGADASRTAGKYTNVTQSATTGQFQNRYFFDITVGTGGNQNRNY